MPNKHYLAGVRLERAVKAEWESKGYLMLRTAGSHGPFDLVGAKDREIVFVQCKRVSTEKAADQMMDAWTSGTLPNHYPHLTQVLAVQIKGQSMVHYVWR